MGLADGGFAAAGSRRTGCALAVCMDAHAHLRHGRYHLSADEPSATNENLRYAIDLLPSMLIATLLFVVVNVGVALVPLADAARCAARTWRVRQRSSVCWRRHGWPRKQRDLRRRFPSMPGTSGRCGRLAPLRRSCPGGAASRFTGWCRAPVSPRRYHRRRFFVGGWRPRALREAEALLAWNVLGQALLVAVLWLTYDRYALVFVPLMAALVLASSPPLRVS